MYDKNWCHIITLIWGLTTTTNDIPSRKDDDEIESNGAIWETKEEEEKIHVLLAIKNMCD